MINEIVAKKPLWVKVLLAYFFLFSTVGFTMFILEEGMQTVMFAAFAYQSSKDWDGLARHLGVMKLVHRAGELYIRYVGWLNPMMWPAYLIYLEANEAFIRAMESRVERRK